jgi:1-acyl-sn-glycerol-3-phosphate acyltransferase
LNGVSERLGFLRLIYRVPWFVLHLLLGTPLTVLFQFAPGRAVRLGGRPLSEVMLTWWSAMLCRIFGLRRKISGGLQPGAQLVVANHISWIDIPLLHSVAAMGFVAKAEIGEWPVIGWLADLGNTVFHHRGSHDSASDVLTAMAAGLEAGERIAIFPEGGILHGPGVKRFHARMFGAAISTGAPVQPVMLRYSRSGAPYEDITFRPKEHFLANFLRLLMQPACAAEVRFLPMLESVGKRRRELAEESEAAVRGAFAGELPRG